MTPTDPVKELIEAAEKVCKGPWMAITDWHRYAVMQENHPHERVVCTVNQSPVHMQGRKMDHLDYCGTDERTADFIVAARNAIPALTALVNEREKVRALIAELRKREVPEHNDYIDVSAEKSAYEWCADALAAILEGK